jgi:hypothetical protein
MDVKQKIVQEVLLSIRTAERGLKPDLSYMDDPLTAADEKYLEMSRDELSALMSQAFTAGDSVRHGYLGERYLDQCDTTELKIHNLTFSFVVKAFKKVSPLVHPNPVDVVTDAYDRAKAQIAPSTV